MTRGLTLRVTPVLMYDTWPMPVLVALFVLLVPVLVGSEYPRIEVCTIGICVPTVICACWLFSTTIDGADRILELPLVCSAFNAT